MIERKLEVIAISDIAVTEVSWLIPPYLPLGKITLLEGDPESGKTFLAVEFAAAVTTGRVIDLAAIPIEGDVPISRNPGSVLYFTGEDDVSDTLKPRLLKQKGDPNRFFIVPGIVEDRDGDEVHQNFTLSCVSELDRALRDYRPQLVVIDPLQAFLGSKVDMHRANEVRPVMAGLKKLAEENGCAILVIRHLNKSVSQRGAYRGMGSIDFTAVARSVLLAGKHPHDAKRFALVHQKCSVGLKGPALTYSIDCSGLAWTGEAELSADDLLGTTFQSAKPRASAVDFLREILAEGPKPATEVKAAAVLKGISSHTLERAKGEAGVSCRPSGFQGGWLWELPKSAGSQPTNPPSAELIH